MLKKKAGQDQPQVGIPGLQGKPNRVGPGGKIKRTNRAGEQTCAEQDAIDQRKGHQGKKKSEGRSAGGHDSTEPLGEFS